MQSWAHATNVATKFHYFKAKPFFAYHITAIQNCVKTPLWPRRATFFHIAYFLCPLMQCYKNCRRCPRFLKNNMCCVYCIQSMPRVYSFLFGLNLWWSGYLSLSLCELLVEIFSPFLAWLGGHVGKKFLPCKLWLTGLPSSLSGTPTTALSILYCCCNWAASILQSCVGLDTFRCFILKQSGLGIRSSVFWANCSLICEKMSEWAIC